MAINDREDAILINAESRKLPNKPHNQPMKQRILDAAQRIITRNPDVEPPPTSVTVTSLALDPASMSLEPGDTVALRVVAMKSDGSSEVVTTVAAFVVTPGGGTVDSAGVYTAGTEVGEHTITATWSGHAAVAAVVITAEPIPPEPSPDYPHQPADYAMLHDHRFDTITGWDPSNANSPWSKVSVETDPTAPHSPSVVRHTYPVGQSGGPFPAKTFSFSEQRELYVCASWKLSKPWDYHVSAVNKMFFINTNHSASLGNEVVFALHGTTESSARIKGADQGAEAGSAYKNPNVNSSPWPLGQYNQLEVVVKQSTGGQSNGEMHWWVNGVKQGEYTNVKYHTTIDAKFKALLWQHYWGGSSDVKAQTDYIWDDHLYISGKA